jgi:hypothetical protein
LTGSTQGDVFAVAVTGDDIRPETIALEHFERRQLSLTRRAIAGMRLERCNRALECAQLARRLACLTTH